MPIYRTLSRIKRVLVKIKHHWQGLTASREEVLYNNAVEHSVEKQLKITLNFVRKCLMKHNELKDIFMKIFFLPSDRREKLQFRLK